MDPHNQMHHYREMKAIENKVRRQIPQMRRIIIVEKEGEDERPAHETLEELPANLAIVEEEDWNTQQ
jgi:hypothetical protein